MKRTILLGILVLGILLGLLNLDRLAYYRAVLTWRLHGIREYEMDELEVTGMGSTLMPSHIQVRDGVIIAVDNPPMSRDQRPAAYDNSRTVDGLFASIERFMNKSGQSPYMMQMVAYDPVFGYPTSIRVISQPEVTVFDAGGMTTISNFKVITTRTIP